MFEPDRFHRSLSEPGGNGLFISPRNLNWWQKAGICRDLQNKKQVYYVSDPNIERFDQLTGLVFSKLYGSFPIPVDLYVMDFKEALFFNRELSEDDKCRGGEPFEFFTGTIDWLIESGYIVERQKSSYAYKFEDCILTAKTLEILKATPSTLSGESIGASLQQAAKGGMVEAIKTLANDALSKGFGLASKAVFEMANS